MLLLFNTFMIKNQYILVIHLVCVGKLKERHYGEACNEYLKRLGRYCKLEVIEVREQSDKNVEVARRKEAGLILGKLAGFKDCFLVALDSRGNQMSSMRFSRILEKPDVCFIIGGPDGLDGSVLGACHLVLSLSEMTLPHQLARVVLLEQVYRGFTILKGERYHK
jgi:23S rRNA (pseudouridine1915-N3)-methyltransferase